MPTLVNGYTYIVPDGQSWSGAPRREPMVRVDHTLGAPSEASFDAGEYPLINNDIPLTGQNVELDLGEGVIFRGPIKDTTLRFEGQNSQAVWGVHLSDYSYFLNRMRPFACHTEVSASTVIASLMSVFTDGTFTTEIEVGMPVVTVAFDGTKDLTTCLNEVMDQVDGRWRLDGRILKAFITDTDPQPDIINDENPYLLYETLKYSEDISQLRNRLYGKGATAAISAVAEAGASMVYVDRIDLFDPAGGLIISGCQRITYGETRETTIITPRDAGGNIDASFLTTETGAVGAPFGAVTLNYAISFITDGEDTQLGPFDSVSPDSVGSGASFGTIDSQSGGQLTPGRSYQYAAGFADADGRITITAGGGGGIEAIVESGDSAFRLEFTTDETALNASRVPSITRFIVRRNLNDVGAPWSIVARGLGLPSGVVYIDGAADASLPAFDPWNFDDDGDPITPGAEPGIDQIGRKIHLTFTIPTDATAKIWRKKSTETNYKLLTTISDDTVTEYIDTTPIENITNTTKTPDPNFPPVVLFGLYGIPATGAGSITERLEIGRLVSLGVVRNDLQAQRFIAEREGGDGVHEDVLDDPSLETVDALNEACDKLLVKIAYPIKNVEYQTRDQKHRVGAKVIFDLPIVVGQEGIFDGQIFDDELFDTANEIGIFGEFTIQEVSIDQFHETTDESLDPRMYVRATTGGRFTFQDLLKKVQVTP